MDSIYVYGFYFEYLSRSLLINGYYEEGKVRYALFDETVMHSIASLLTKASSSVSSGTN